MIINLNTKQKRQIIDITSEVDDALHGSGLVNIFCKHTTASISVADLDPGTDEDILNAIDSMTPKRIWNHPHDPKHFPDHLWSTLMGPAITIPFNNTTLSLGTWQRIVFIELDGPRQRHIEITLINTD